MSNASKWLLIRVSDLETGARKVNVHIPVSLANFGIKMARKYSPESLEGLDMEAILAAVSEDGGDGVLVDVEDVERGEHVEVMVA